MKTINDFLESKGINIAHADQKIELSFVKELMSEYAKMVREEQIIYSAIGATHNTPSLCNVPENLDKNLKSYLQVCRVEIT